MITPLITVYIDLVVDDFCFVGIGEKCIKSDGEEEGNEEEEGGIGDSGNSRVIVSGTAE